MNKLHDHTPKFDGIRLLDRADLDHTKAIGQYLFEHLERESDITVSYGFVTTQQDRNHPQHACIILVSGNMMVTTGWSDTPTFSMPIAHPDSLHRLADYLNRLPAIGC